MVPKIVPKQMEKQGKNFVHHRGIPGNAKRKKYSQ